MTSGDVCLATSLTGCDATDNPLLTEDIAGLDKFISIERVVIDELPGNGIALSIFLKYHKVLTLFRPEFLQLPFFNH